MSGTNIALAEILERIPHRDPFLFIDRAEDFREGQSIVGVKDVTGEEPFFAGHFPGNPVMPGVLIVEAMAQTSALLMSKSLSIDPVGKTIFFMAIENCRFRQPVRPGDQLRMEVAVVFHRRNIFKFHGQALVDDKLAAEADFAAMLVDTPNG